MKLGSSIKHPVTSNTVGMSPEGRESYQGVRKYMRYSDGVTIRAESELGFMPYAYAIGMSPSTVPGVSLALAANGGSLAAPVVLEGHMLLESVTYRDRSATLARGPVSVYLYEERLGNTGTLDLVPGATGTLAQFTANAAANRTINITSPPVYLAPGVYWLVMRNGHASTPLQPAAVAAGTMAQNSMQQKTLASAPGSTLDFVTGWTKAATPFGGLKLNGRVFGQAASF